MLHRLAAALAALCLSTVGISADEPKPSISPVVQLNQSCTGFHIGEGLIATAAHCISKLADHDVALSDGTVVKGTLFFLSRAPHGDDLAVIKIDTIAAQETLTLSCGSPPPVKAAIYMTGYPALYGLATVWGRVASETRGFVGYWRVALPINISSYGGFSGSPVMLESNDRVIGVLVGSLPENKTLAVAVPAYRLCGLLALEVGV